MSLGGLSGHCISHRTIGLAQTLSALFALLGVPESAVVSGDYFGNTC